MGKTPEPQGYIKAWRKFMNDWKWENPLHRSAFLWMLVMANWSDGDGLKRGQLRFSIYWAPRVWGMSKSSASRFLDKCVIDGTITWEKGAGGHLNPGTLPGTVGGTLPGTLPGIITILNYDKYQTTSNGSGTLPGTVGGTLGGTILKEEEKKKIKKKNNIVVGAPPPEQKRITKKKSVKPKADIRELSDYYCERYLHFHGVPLDAGKRWIHFTKVIKGHLDRGAYTVDEIKRRINIWLNDSSIPAEGNHHNPAAFANNIQRYDSITGKGILDVARKLGE